MRANEVFPTKAQARGSEADRVSRESKAIVDLEVAERNKKTARLKQMRLDRDAQQVSEPAPAPTRKRAKATPSADGAAPAPARKRAKAVQP